MPEAAAPNLWCCTLPAAPVNTGVASCKAHRSRLPWLPCLSVLLYIAAARSLMVLAQLLALCTHAFPSAWGRGWRPVLPVSSSRLKLLTELGEVSRVSEAGPGTMHHPDLPNPGTGCLWLEEVEEVSMASKKQYNSCICA